MQKGADTEVKKLVDNAVRSVQENKLENAVYTAYKDLDDSLVDYLGERSCNIYLGYTGKKLSFTLDLHNFYIPIFPQHVFPNSNERYSADTIRDISMLGGIKNIIAISGGGDQVLALTSLLQKNNYIRSVSLCDINPNQLLINALMLAKYDTMPDFIRPAMYAYRPDKDDATKLIWPSNRIDIMDGTVFNLQEGKLTELVNRLARGNPLNSCFVYGSNAYTIDLPGAYVGGWTGWEETKGMLDALGSGSVYMGTSPYSPRSVIVRAGYRVYSYCSPKDDEYMDNDGQCIHPSVLRRGTDTDAEHGLLLRKETDIGIRK